MEKNVEVPIFLVACLGYSQDRSYSILGRIAGAYWSETIARERAQYETLGYFESNNKKYRQEVAVLQGCITNSGPVKRIFVVFSNAYFKDSSGRCGFKIDGIFHREPDADKCLENIRQGLQEIFGSPAEVQSQKIQLEVSNG